jgi:hypothetical protein
MPERVSSAFVAADADSQFAAASDLQHFLPRPLYAVTIWMF